MIECRLCSRALHGAFNYVMHVYNDHMNAYGYTLAQECPWCHKTLFNYYDNSGELNNHVSGYVVKSCHDLLELHIRACPKHKLFQLSGYLPPLREKWLRGMDVWRCVLPHPTRYQDD